MCEAYPTSSGRFDLAHTVPHAKSATVTHLVRTTEHSSKAAKPWRTARNLVSEPQSSVGGDTPRIPGSSCMGWDSLYCTVKGTKVQRSIDGSIAQSSTLMGCARYSMRNKIARYQGNQSDMLCVFAIFYFTNVIISGIGGFRGRSL